MHKVTNAFELKHTCHTNNTHTGHSKTTVITTLEHLHDTCGDFTAYDLDSKFKKIKHLGININQYKTVFAKH